MAIRPAGLLRRLRASDSAAIDSSRAQVIGHHGVWGAFAFWSPELDAIITGTVNTAKVDRRPLLREVVRVLSDSLHDGSRRRHL